MTRNRLFLPLFLLTALVHVAGTSWGAPVTEGTAKDGVTLVANGQPTSVIVLPDFAGRSADDLSVRMEGQAANVMVDFVQRMSGAKIDIVFAADLGEVQVDGDSIKSEKVPADSYILIGDSAITRRMKTAPEAKESGATYVRAAGNTVVLMGGEDGTPYSGGAVYSAHTVLESLGCRYLWPGKLGLVIPAKSTVTVPSGTTKYVPTIKQRYMRMSVGYDRGMKGAGLLGIGEDEWKQTNLAAPNIDPKFVDRGCWEQWQKLGGITGINGGHAFGAIYDQEKDAHPGWFALQPDGTRTQKSAERAQLCVSNSELIDHIADDLIAKIKADPTIKCVSLSPNDGGPDAFCMCQVNALGEPGCMTLDPPNGRVIKNFRGWNRDYVSLTDRYVYFWNKIAEKVEKERPDMLFIVDAYSYYEAPPVERTLNPNFVVRYIQATLKDWGEWSDKSSKMFWRPNILHGPWQVGYLQINREWAKDLNYTAHHGTFATDFDSIISNWATEGLNYYILAKLNYNPDLNVEALIDDYCNMGFGAAGSDIRKYYTLVEGLTDKQQVLEKAGFAEGGSYLIHPRIDGFAQVYQTADIAALRACLDAADKRAAGDETVRQRIAFLRVGLDWTDIQSRAYRMLLAWKQKQPVDLIAGGKLLEQRRDMMRSIFRKNTLAVNISYAYWGDRAYWQAFEAAVAEAEKKQVAAPGKTEIEADEQGQPIVH